MNLEANAIELEIEELFDFSLDGEIEEPTVEIDDVTIVVPPALLAQLVTDMKAPATA